MGGDFPATLAADFAWGFHAADAKSPIAVNQRTGAPYKPGLGPHTEAKTIDLVLDELRASKPSLYSMATTNVPYPKPSRQKCDLVLGDDDGKWFVEVKMMRLMGDNGKENDNIITHILSPYPTKAENFDTGINNSGLNIDGLGNVWITNRFGTGLLGMMHLVDMGVRAKLEGVAKASDYLTKTMSEQKGGAGSVTLLRPDGSPYPGSPFKGGGLPGPWAVVVDGNDNVWISNFNGPSSPIVQLCGARTENCPPGFKTGDQISPPGGYVGGGLQMLTDIAVDPAGNVWAMNNWQDIDSCMGPPDEALSTRCGGQGVVIFYGMAKPVRAPQIGPARQP
jgi:hypothetical protein